MGIPVVLWAALSDNDSSHLTQPLSRRCELHCITRVDDIPGQIARRQPDLLCFDFDYPTFAGLTSLRETKQRYPSLPILMLTGSGSEALAVWALRSRIWDYFTKPVDKEELLSRIHLIGGLGEYEESGARRIAMPAPPVPVQFRVGSRSGNHPTFRALSYIENHFHEKLSLHAVAACCGMEATAFSHAFKNEHGYTFREFLQQRRIEKAVELLRHTDTCILEIACTVGFRDPSQFTRMFKRHMGVTPSEFRAAHRGET